MFQRVLAVMALACLGPSLIHIFMGSDGDILIGASASNVPTATLDSQNRFYGATFALYGALLLYCASDVRRYSTILKLVFGGIFLGGLARILSYHAYGLPSFEVQVLWATEIIIPPLLWLWLNRHLTGPKD